MKFDCEKCGLCCRAVGCSLLNEKNECPIYKDRPEICNVEKQYQKVNHLFSQDVWNKLEKQCCGVLQKTGDKKWIR